MDNLMAGRRGETIRRNSSGKYLKKLFFSPQGFGIPGISQFQHHWMKY
jgi:hypothetical protein